MEQTVWCDYLQDIELYSCTETEGFMQPAHTLSWELLK